MVGDRQLVTLATVRRQRQVGGRYKTKDNLETDGRDSGEVMDRVNSSRDGS